uniref:Uncharacterized protein n=1 Tax=Oryza brachyantha TaxID=4533 RepID=J3L6I9_ORYBR
MDGGGTPVKDVVIISGNCKRCHSAVCNGEDMKLLHLLLYSCSVMNTIPFLINHQCYKITSLLSIP